jgi:hypothetical protein
VPCNKLITNTVLINGASGGLLGAAYFRELYRLKLEKSPLIYKTQLTEMIFPKIY